MTQQPHVSLCADAETFAATEVRIQPYEGKGQAAILTVEIGGVSIQSFQMEPGEFADHLQRIADRVRVVASDWEQQQWEAQS